MLTIIALLMGGIIGGEALVRDAGIRSVGQDFQRYQEAVHQFYDKYNALPGDMTNATSYWGSAGGTGSDATCQGTIVTTGTATCNGNGDGTIGAATSNGEYYRFWQQLVNAGFVAGYFTGAPAASPSAAGYNDVIGTNVPKSKIPGLGFAVPSINGSVFTSLLTSNWVVAAPCCNSNLGLEGRAVRTEDAWNLDTKLDDGYPGFGTVQILTAYYSTCSTTNVATTATYALSTTGANCPLAYNLGL